MSIDKELERLASVETKLAAIENVVVRMEEKIDSWQTNYASRVEINEMLRIRDIQIEQLRCDLREAHARELENRQTNKQIVPQWAAVTIALASLAVSFLLR